MEGILGMHYCLPPTRLTNDELAERFGEEEIRTLEEIIGIRSRRVDGSVLEMSYYACRHVMKELFVRFSNVGLLLVASQTGDYRVPANACVLHGLLGMHEQCLAFDANLGCSGFPYALSIASSLMDARNIQLALVVNADAISNYLNPRRRGLMGIHGDGAVATVMVQHSGHPIVGVELGTDGSGYREITLLGGQGTHYLEMNGAAVSHFAMRRMPAFIQDVSEKLGYGRNLERVDLLLLHQANRQIVQSIYETLGVPTQKQFFYLEEVGNTASASSPMVLAEAWKTGNIVDGDRVLVASFGNGLSWGCAAIEFTIADDCVQGTVEQDELRELYGPITL